LEIPVESPEVVASGTPSADPAPAVITDEPNGKDLQAESPQVEKTVRVSAFSLKSIKAKKELEQQAKAAIGEENHLPTESFNKTDMMMQWTRYAQRLGDRGQKIMESLMLMSDPKLQGTTIVHELPNEGTKIDFESGKTDLLGYLRGKLHNHDIDLKIVVNESIDSRKAFTPQDRYNRLNQINPSLELLRKTFDLDL
jgi:hypothetical protein